MDQEKNTIVVGSRKSQLALIQTNYVVKCLKEFYPEKKFEIVTMSTMGDKILDKPLPKIGEKSLFTKELEIALANKDVDLVVHSLKDLPTTLPEGMCIGAVLKREDPRDSVIVHPELHGKTLETLPKGSVIGTSSLRRTAQLKRKYPHLSVSDIRGNLNTRLKKLDSDKKYQAIVLASAGLIRMDWEKRIDQTLEAEDMLYAVGQGALAVECGEHDQSTLQLLERLHHGPTALRVLAERSFLCTLGGGCSAPVAVHSSLKGKELTLTGAVWSLDGTETLEEVMKCHLKYCSDDEDDGPRPRKCPFRMPQLYCGMAPSNLTYTDLDIAEELGHNLASKLIKLGALSIMNEAKKTNNESIPH